MSPFPRLTLSFPVNLDKSPCKSSISAFPGLEHYVRPTHTHFQRNPQPTLQTPNTNSPLSPALWAALNQLNYSTYHGFEACFDNANGSLDFWNAAIEAKEHQQKNNIKTSPTTTTSVPTTALDFDRALWRYDALTDTPCVLFAEELLTAYPNAKVILTYRDPDSWVVSMQRSYYAVLQSRSAKIMCLLDPAFMRKYHAMGMGTLRAWTGGLGPKPNPSA